MTKALLSTSDPVHEQRNARGQWVAGVSGNRSGRPRKKATLPKSLTEHLADAMTEKIPLIDVDGNQEMVPAYEAVARQLVRSLPSLNAKELIAALRWMDVLQVYDEMRRRVGNCSDGLTIEQKRERLAALLTSIQEEQAARG